MIEFWNLLFVAILFSASTTMYTSIVFALGKRNSVTKRVETDDRAIKVRNQVAKMLIANGIIFFVLHLPVKYFIIHRRPPEEFSVTRPKHLTVK